MNDVRPAANGVKECWDLVNTSERTRRHCMMLENCCYDFFELTCLNMIQEGLFGEIVHAEGSYCHNLDPYWDRYEGDWRMIYNREHKGDVYPTHGIGPVCQDLGIPRGSRMAGPPCSAGRLRAPFFWSGLGRECIQFHFSYVMQ